MSAQIRAWHTEHMYFGRLLERLRRELDLFAIGERPNYALMLDILTYLGEFCDRVHHRREDAAFACLARRFPELQLPLARLQQEHRVIAHAGEALRALIAEIVEGAFVPRAEVEAAAATYLVYYRSHIEHEEREILGRAAAELSSEDWEAVRNAAPHGEDPLFGAAPHERFRQLRREIALEG
ncbi:MAG TPA: hemerythrin domain-containing protein [Burkholderiales bacterium]|jgi:hemerythrin-like domain-containing protein|nr:hemerythrin domain-containing protein [Burkholderiales bacterium]